MKTALYILLGGFISVRLLACVAVATNSICADEDEEWVNYKAKYKRIYTDPDTDAMRRSLWLTAKQRVENLYSEGDLLDTLGITHLFDRTPEEQMCLTLWNPDCPRNSPNLKIGFDQEAMISNHMRHEGLVSDCDHQRTQSPDRSDDEFKVQIDAFDMNICGKAKFEPWQQDQGAFGCNGYYDFEQSFTELRGLHEMVFGTRIGTNASFPFYAQVDVYHYEYHMDQCSGVIVHKDLVLTTRTCLRRVYDDMSYVNVTVRIGAAKGRREREYVVEKICRPDIIETRGMNIALLKLKKPIDYAKEHVAPACLRPSQSPSSTAYCSLAFEEGLFSLRGRRSCKLSTIPKTTRYIVSTEGLETYDKFTDIGGPVVCYDRCAAGNSTRAFVVGIINRGLSIEDSSAIVSDLHMQREAIEKLVQEANLEHDKSDVPYQCVTIKAN